MFPLVAVPHQSYLVLITEYTLYKSVLCTTGIVNLWKLVHVYLKMLFPYFAVFSQVATHVPVFANNYQELGTGYVLSDN